MTTRARGHNAVHGAKKVLVDEEVFPEAFEAWHSLLHSLTSHRAPCVARWGPHYIGLLPVAAPLKLQLRRL